MLSATAPTQLRTPAPEDASAKGIVLAEIDPAIAASTTTLVVIDAAVDQVAQLVAGVAPGAAHLVLRSDQDGVSQISAAVAQMAALRSLHLISHGSPGCLRLGNGELSLASLADQGPAIAQWFSATLAPATAELLLYGCNVAAGDAGAELLQRLQDLTGAAIAASSRPVGSAQAGGNWSLDVTTTAFAPQLALSEALQTSYASTFDWFQAEKILADFDPNENAANPNATSRGDVDIFDQFGTSVAIYEGFAVVGVPNNSDIINPATNVNFPGFSDVGSVYVFRSDPATGDWIRDAKIEANDPAAGALFGQAVDISSLPAGQAGLEDDDYYIAVGAPGARTPALDPTQTEQTGAAYVFRRNAATGTWTQVQKLAHTETNPLERAGDRFGESIGIDGDTIVVGSPNDRPAGQPDVVQAGAAYIFQTANNGATWTQVGGKIGNPDASQPPNFSQLPDRFGASVAIADGNIIIGSPGAKRDGILNPIDAETGRAYIYSQTNGTWDPAPAPFKIEAADGGQGDNFGFSVDIGHGYAIVGAPNDDVSVFNPANGQTTTFADAGGAYIFWQQPDGSWVQIQKLDGAEGPLRAGDQFGNSVGIDDGVAIVGAYTEEFNFPDFSFPNPNPNTNLPRPGVSYIYELNNTNGAWEQTERLTGSDRRNGDEFGFAVDIYTSPQGSSSAISGARDKNLVLDADDDDPSQPDGRRDINSAGAAYIYRTQPQVQSVTPNVVFVNDPLIAGTNPAAPGVNYLLLSVVYDQPMNVGIVPQITFPNPFENPGSTTGATPSFFQWAPDGRTFVARYDLTDINVEQFNIDVAIDGGRGISGAPQVPALPPNPVVSDIFSIDTRNPTANFFEGYFDGLGLTQPVPAAVNRAFTFVASFDEVVASPAFDFVNATITDFVFDGGGTGSFTVTPINEGLVSVTLAADSTVDLRGNLSNRPPVFSTIYDITPPEVTLTPIGFNPAVALNTPFTVRATFSEDVVGFEATDIFLGNAVLVPGSFTAVSAREFTFSADPTVLGAIMADVTVAIGAGVATDIATNPNNAATDLALVYDGERPTVTLSSSFADPVEGPFAVEVVFSENVAVLEATDFNVVNGIVTSVFGSGSTYQVDVLPISEGLVEIALNENTAADSAGNLNLVSNVLSRTYDPPVPVVTQVVPSVATLSDGSVGQVFTLSITYSREMNPAIAPTITFPNPTENPAGTITPTTGMWTNGNRTFVQSYTVTDVNVDVANIDVASANAEDPDGNVQEAANSIVSNVFSIEMLSPTVTLSADSSNSVTVIFSEPVTDFTAADITVVNGTASNVQGSGTTYSFTLTPTAAAPIEVTIAANVALDPSGNGNQASETLIIDDINDAPVITPPTAAQAVNGDKVLRFSAANGNAIRIADVDAGGQPIEVQLTAAQGLVTLTNTTGLTFLAGDGFADGVITFRGTLANVNAALEGLRFKPVNLTGNASLTVSVNDLGNTGLTGGPQSDVETINIAVTKVAQNDFNGDGFSDVLLRNSFSGDNLVRFMNGTTVLNDGNLGRPIPDVNWRFERTGDFNGDGKADILLRNYNGSGQNLIWYMDGSTILGEELAGRLVTDPAWEIEGTGDFNSDGQTDIILKNYNSDQNLIWYMNGSQIIQEGLFGRDLGDLTWRIQGTADFNGDGQTDILLRHMNPNGLGQNIVWFMNGPNIIGESPIGRDVPDVNWEIAGAADFNGDGQSDILLRNYATGANLLWEMSGTSIIRETFIQSTPDTNWQATV